MGYYRFLNDQLDAMQPWLELRKEQGADTDQLAQIFSKELDKIRKKLETLPVDQKLAQKEPNDLETIRKLRTKGPRLMSFSLTPKEMEDRILGAYLARAAGCTLGIPCESMDRDYIRRICKEMNQQYPLKDYWKSNPRGGDFTGKHYGITPRIKFYKNHIDRVGADDDIIYTLLGLLILEKYGVLFTTEQVGQAWLQYLPGACTAEHVALENLKSGVKPPETAIVNNPYNEWIGADIRCDPWGYVSPGMPERAAELAWQDARLSHVRNGIYGSMFFAATIAAAFATSDVNEAITIGLSEIPKTCRLYSDIKKTLQWCQKDQDWDRTMDRIYKEFKGMSGVHTNNNAAITVAGLVYGAGNLERTLTLTVMGGLDTDCTAATAGSVVGAMHGANNLPKKWIGVFNNRTEAYLIGKRNWRNDALARRFTKLAIEHRKKYSD